MASHRKPRRSARIASHFWVAVEGVNMSEVLRLGNLSPTGVYFEASELAGPVGSVQSLSLRTADREVGARVLARVLRVSTIDDLQRGTMYGMALEFMPPSPESRTELDTLIRHAAHRDLLGLRHAAGSAPITQTGSKKRPSTVDGTRRVYSIRIVSDENAQMNERYTMQLGANEPPYEAVALDLKVTRVDPLPDEKFEIHFSTIARSSSPADTINTMVNSDEGEFTLIEDAIPPRNDLSGQLSRIKLPTLLGLIEIDRMSGRLSLQSFGKEAYILIAEGRILDLYHPEKSGSTVDVLSDLLRWTEGFFQFQMRQIESEELESQSIQALLLEAARIEDENYRS